MPFGLTNRYLKQREPAFPYEVVNDALSEQVSMNLKRLGSYK